MNNIKKQQAIAINYEAENQFFTQSFFSFHLQTSIEPQTPDWHTLKEYWRSIELQNEPF